MVVKSQNQKYWAHKASFVGFPQSPVPINAVAVSYAATNDGQTLVSHLKRLAKHVPIVVEKVDRILADGSFNTSNAKDFVGDKIEAVLYTQSIPKTSTFHRQTTSKALSILQRTVSLFAMLVCL